MYDSQGLHTDQYLQLIVIASIHQPSTSTFNVFDKLLLLSGGKTHYFGPLRAVTPYYESIGHPVPVHMNPAEFLLDQVNVDFAPDKAEAQNQLLAMQQSWAHSVMAEQLSNIIGYNKSQQERAGAGAVEMEVAEKKPSFLSLVLTLLHRSFIKSHRDVVAYGVRMAMYLGLAIMMGTVWVRLRTEQEYIQPYINAIVGFLPILLLRPTDHMLTLFSSLAEPLCLLWL